MAAHPSTAEASRPNMSNVVNTIIAGIAVRLIIKENIAYIALADLLAILGYTSSSCFRGIFSHHGYDFKTYCIRVGFNNMQAVNEAGLHIICKIVKPRRTEQLLRWLNSGGLQAVLASAQVETHKEPEAAVAPTQAAAPPAGEAPAPQTAKPAPAATSTLQPLQPGNRIRSIYAGRTGVVVRTYQDGSAAVAWDDGEPQGEGLAHERVPRRLLELVKPARAAAAQERRKAYCRELCKVIARYADDEEALELAHALEHVSSRILTRRHSPGLNAAAYDVFARYSLKGAMQ